MLPGILGSENGINIIMYYTSLCICTLDMYRVWLGDSSILEWLTTDSDGGVSYHDGWFSSSHVL